jgi:hypothetical protein
MADDAEQALSGEGNSDHDQIAIFNGIYGAQNNPGAGWQWRFQAGGETPEKALKNAKEAIQLWIDTAKEFGDTIPEPKGDKLIYA